MGSRCKEQDVVLEMENRLTLVALMGILITALALSMTVFAKDKQNNASNGDVKELSGISVVGNKEAPKSLFIVPWKSSELGVETDLSSKLLDEKMNVVDKDVFERELEFYSATNNN